MKRFLSLQCRDIVIVVSLTMFMVQLDASILLIALPDIGRSFGVPTISLSLAVTLYLTMIVAFLPLSGWAADRFGPRRVMCIAMIGFATSSLLCALAQGYWQFIAFRALMGICASLLTPVGRLIMLKQVSKGELVDALAITAMPMLVAPTLGPSIGGLIVDLGRWEYIFLLNIPVALALLLVTLWRIEEVPRDPGRALDWIGALLLAAASITMLAGIDGLAGGFTDPRPWMLILAGLLLCGLTWRHLTRHPGPIVTLSALRIPAFRTTVLGAGAAIRLPARAMLFVLPLMFQGAFGFGPFVAGLLLMALNGGDLVSKPFVVRAYGRYGFRETIAAFSLLGLAALMVVAVAGRWDAVVSVILVSLFLCGVARSVVFTGMASLTFTALPAPEMSSGNVVANISMQLFNALAVSLTAFILSMSSWAHGHAEPALIDYQIALGAVALVGLLSTLALWRQLPRQLDDIHADEVA